MSNRMLTLAWDTKVATSAMKCLLLSLADHHNENTNLCFPSIKRLATKTSMTHQSVINNTIKLVKAGLITVQKDAGYGSGARSNKYTLHLRQSQKDLPASKSKKLTTPKVKEIEGKVNFIKRQSQGDRKQSQGGLPEPLYNSYKEPLVNQSRSNDFDRWWSIYPKKVKKKPAAAIWKKKKPDVEVLIADIQERLARDSQWQTKEFIPNPTTYLNDEGWNDEIQTSRKAGNGTGKQPISPATANREAAAKYFSRSGTDNGDSVAEDDGRVSALVG